VFLLSFSVMRNFRGTCSSVEMLKEDMVRKRLGAPCPRNTVDSSKEVHGQNVRATGRSSFRNLQNKNVVFHLPVGPLDPD